jgi:hypothetical protein
MRHHILEELQVGLQVRLNEQRGFLEEDVVVLPGVQ